MSKTASDYILRVRVGPDYDTSKMKVVNVNDEMNPFYLDTPHFEGFFVIRIANFNGIVPESKEEPIQNPASGYFEGKNRRYSIMIQGRFKKEWKGDDLLFGAEFENPVRLPTGWQFALKIAQWLDPNMIADLSSEKPSIFSPLICSMNAIAVHSLESLHTGHPPSTSNYASKKSITSNESKRSIFKKIRKKSTESLGSPVETSEFHSALSIVDSKVSSSIGIWSYHSKMIQDDLKLMKSEFEMPEALPFDKRKKFFSDSTKRSQVTFTPEHVYCMDFYDAYIDFNTVSLKLPGLSLNAFRYWDGQPLRYTVKSRDGTILFCVSFELIEKSTIN